MTINIEEINSGRVQGYVLTPENNHGKGTIITFGGSEGSSWLEKAVEIAQNGYYVLAVYYFGKGSLPSALAYIELSFFDDILNYIKQDKGLQHPITIVGISRGAELALILAEHYAVVSNIILYSPSAYIFSGSNDEPSWLINGKVQPYITFSKKTRRKRFWNKKMPLVDSFTYELENNKQIGDYFIDISTFKGNILLFAGEQDQVWPSEHMANLIKEKAISANQVELITFKEAGHTFNYYHFNGGSSDGNIFAYHKSREIMLERLSLWHK